MAEEAGRQDRARRAALRNLDRQSGRGNSVSLCRRAEGDQGQRRPDGADSDGRRRDRRRRRRRCRCSGRTSSRPARKSEAPAQALAHPRKARCSPRQPPRRLLRRSPGAAAALRRRRSLRSGPTAKKFAALRWSAASRAKTISISHRFPAPAPAAASASRIFSPPSKAARSGAASGAASAAGAAPRARRFCSAARRGRRSRIGAFSKPPCRARKCTSATTKSSRCP